MDSTRTAHYQTLAVTILAIATAVVGFGLFNSEQLAGINLRGSPETLLVPAFKLAFGLNALAQYGILVGAVGGLLKQETPVTGRQVAHGPLLLMAWVIVSVALIFIIGIFEMPPNPVGEDKAQ